MTAYELTWINGGKTKGGKRRQGRWRKKHRKQPAKYFSLLPGETKASSYQRCLRECRKWMAEVDGRLDSQSATATRDAWMPVATALQDAMQSIIDRHGDTEQTRLIYRDLRQTFGDRLLEASIAGGVSPGDDDVETIVGMIADHADSLSQIHWQPPVSGDGNLVSAPELASGQPPWESEPDHDNTLAALADRFANGIKVEQSLQHAHETRKQIANFLGWLPAGCGVEEAFGGSTLESYRQHVLGLDLADKTKSNRINPVKQFARWLYRIEAISEIPRAIVTDSYAIEVGDSEVKPYRDEEVTAILAECKPREQLYVLLGLNCGMLQGDVADLKHSEIDWQAGTITRQRSKKKKKENLPTICWKLWPATLKLLSTSRSDDTDRALLNAQGRPLAEKKEVNGKYTKTDTIGKAMGRIRDRMKRMDPPARTEPISFKRFRSTAASKLGQHESYRAYAQHFLAHAPTNVADKHYVTPSQDQFDRAVAWLGEQFLIRK